MEGDVTFRHAEFDIESRRFDDLAKSRFASSGYFVAELIPLCRGRSRA